MLFRSGGSDSETQPQAVDAPELGDAHEIGGYILVLILLLLMILTFVIQCKRDEEE